MPFIRPTLQEIDDRIQSDIKSRIENGSTLLRRSVLKILGRVYAGAVHLLYGFIEYMKDQIFLSTADVQYLERASEEYGITRKAATYSIGEATATGTNGVIIPVESQLQSSDAQKYSVNAEAVISGGTADLSLIAMVGGADGNQDPGTILTFISPLSGVNSTVTIDSNGLTGGVDEESDNELRDRALTRKKQPPHGGALFDYVNWALEVSGVTRAWAFAQYQGIGTVGLAFVRDNDDPIIPNSKELEEVRQYILQHTDANTGKIIGLPVGALPGFFMIPLENYAVTFDLSIIPNTSSVKESVQEKLEDLFIQEGGPGQTIYLYEMVSAVSTAVGLTAIKFNTPNDDIAIPTNKLPVVGAITWEDY